MKAATTEAATVNEEPWNLYYMRDNHTFRRLPNDVEAAIAAIEEDFAQGYRWGMLCASRKSEPTHYREVVHAHGIDRWYEFEDEARDWLTTILAPATPT